MEFILINIGLILINLAIFGCSLKLYTEYFKEGSQRNRKRDGV